MCRLKKAKIFDNFKLISGQPLTAAVWFLKLFLYNIRSKDIILTWRNLKNWIIFKGWRYFQWFNLYMWVFHCFKDLFHSFKIIFTFYLLSKIIYYCVHVNASAKLIEDIEQLTNFIFQHFNWQCSQWHLLQCLINALESELHFGRSNTPKGDSEHHYLRSQSNFHKLNV